MGVCGAQGAFWLPDTGPSPDTVTHLYESSCVTGFWNKSRDFNFVRALRGCRLWGTGSENRNIKHEVGQFQAWVTEIMIR